MFSAGLRSLLQLHFSEPLIAETTNGAAALACLEDLKPDIVIIDLHLPDQNGIAVSRQILQRQPSARLIMISGDSNLAHASEALQAGISAYLLKMNAPEELTKALDAVLADKIYLCAEANEFVLRDYRRAMAGNPPSPKTVLSVREREVLCLMAEGLRTKDIALRLAVSVKSAETYRQRLMRKLSCFSTAELVRYAVREHLIQP